MERDQCVDHAEYDLPVVVREVVDESGAREGIGTGGSWFWWELSGGGIVGASGELVKGYPEKVGELGKGLETETAYPFGMFAFGSKAEGYESDRRDYTGHERVGVTDAPGSRYQSVLDAGARTYIPGLGIFAQVDPLADQMPSYSPYAYGFNDPITFTDPTGLAPATFGTGRSNGELGSTSADLTMTDPRGWDGVACCGEEFRQFVSNVQNDGLGTALTNVADAVFSPSESNAGTVEAFGQVTTAATDAANAGYDAVEGAAQTT